jgi:hypothetical protein
LFKARTLRPGGLFKASTGRVGDLFHWL